MMILNNSLSMELKFREEYWTKTSIYLETVISLYNY